MIPIVRSICTAMVLLGLLVSASEALASEVLLSPTSATASIDTETTYPACVPEKMIDQSGLVNPFTSGVTKYDTYMSGQPLNQSASKDNCYISENDYYGSGVDLVFDLGASYDVKYLVVWNSVLNGETDAGIKDVEIGFSQDSDFTTATWLYDVVIPKAQLDEQDRHEAFVLSMPSTTSAQYVKISASTNHGNPGHYSVSEVALGVVPEPATMSLLGLGGLALIRRRRTA